MKVVAVLLAVLVVAYAAPDPEKRFIKDTFQHAIDAIKNTFNKLWNSTKDEFNHLKNGIHIDFDSVVHKLIPLIDSSTSEAGCLTACTGAAATVLTPLAVPIAGSLCRPACKAALAKLEQIAG
ncbi:conotoxin Cl14.12-like isoform X1 [Littorina saxatilis]|uniref:Uncharacterized protein n=1 Tax=Littorina saxatilis TaxID=31220 RepID=A0AAN9GJJ2_9CAEN